MVKPNISTFFPASIFIGFSLYFDQFQRYNQ